MGSGLKKSMNLKGQKLMEMTAPESMNLKAPKKCEFCQPMNFETQKSMNLLFQKSRSQTLTIRKSFKDHEQSHQRTVQNHKIWIWKQIKNDMNKNQCLELCCSKDNIFFSNVIFFIDERNRNMFFSIFHFDRLTWIFLAVRALSPSLPNMATGHLT